MPDDDARGDAADEDEQDGGAREEADYTDYTQQRLDPKTLADYRRQWRSVVEWEFEPSYLFGKQANALSCFTKWLKATCDANESELLQMGIAIADLGTHSFRKGAATYLAGFVAGPTVIAIYLRAG